MDHDEVICQLRRYKNHVARCSHGGATQVEQDAYAAWRTIAEEVCPDLSSYISTMPFIIANWRDLTEVQQERLLSALVILFKPIDPPPSSKNKPTQ